jgi:hypothetical protein
MLGLVVAKQFTFSRDRQSAPDVLILAILECDSHVIVAAMGLIRFSL